MSGKVLIIGDIHIGARNGSPEFHEYFNHFYSDLFEYIDKNNIKTIIQTGDLFDVRKNVSTWVLSFFKEKFLQEIIKRNIHVYVTIGNHDIYFKDSLEIHTPGLILKEYQTNFTVIDTPRDIDIEGHSFLLVPWITKINLKDIESSVKKSKSKYCSGHFEFDGFYMHKGTVAKSHFKHDSFNKFKTVFSGHFHTRSQRDNVLYVGTPYEITWIDANDDKGFHVLHEDGKIEFVKNHHSIHKYLTYPSIEDVSNQYVRIILTERPDPKEYQKYRESIDLMKPHDVKYQEKFQESYASTVNMEKIASTEEMIFQFVDDSETELDKIKIKTYLSDLFRRAGENS